MFGRRKDGFSKEVEVTDYKNEYNEDEYHELRQETTEEKVNLLDYLDELDEGNELASERDLNQEEIVEEKSPVQLLSDFIRERSIASYLTSEASLYKDDENVKEILNAMLADENYSDIVTIEGTNDIYYYSNQVMSDNYAMIAMLVEDKALARTIAEMVRWNAKTYPCPTPLYYFKNSPYSYSIGEIEVAFNELKKVEEYKDICEIVTGNNVKYLYSTLHMSEKYARSLAESTEYGEYGYL